MSEPNKRVEELLARVTTTTEARYRAGERLARHQKLSLWTLAYLALALVLIPLVQALEVPTGLDPAYLNAAVAVLAVLTLVYALLVGMEKFVAQAASMRRSAVELDRLARRIGARDPHKLTDAEYAALVREYFDVIDRYEHHQPVDYLRTRLGPAPKKGSEWPAYAWLWLRVQAAHALDFIHYLVALAFAGFIFILLLSGIGRHAELAGPLQLRASETLDSAGAQQDSQRGPGDGRQR